MDVRLPDGTIIKGVPDGMSKADLTAKLQANGYDVSKLTPAPAQPTEAPAKSVPDPGMYSKVRNLVAPTVEALGAGGGAILGGAAGSLLGPIGTATGAVGGAGLGYGIAKEALELADVHLGGKAPRQGIAQVTEPVRNIIEGGAFEAGGRIAAPVIQKAVGKIADMRRIPLNRVSNVARGALGADLDQTVNALRSAPPNASVAEVTAKIQNPAWQTLVKESLENTPGGAQYLNKFAQMSHDEGVNALSKLAGGTTATDVRATGEVAKQNLNAVTGPMREAALGRANLGKYVADEVAVREAGDLATLVGTGAKIDPTRFATQASGAEKALRSVGIKPLEGAPLANRIASIRLADEFAGNDLIEGSVKAIADDITKWTGAGGVIDAAALEAIRKNSVNAAIAKLRPGMDATSQRNAAAGVLSRVKPVIDNAIEAAGGTGWRDYLTTHAKGMQKIAEKQLTGEALRLWKSDKDAFVRLVQNESPDAVEKVLGPGKYNIATELAESTLSTLQAQAEKHLAQLAASKQAEAGHKALTTLLQQNAFRFRLPSWLSFAGAAINKTISELERAIGDKSMRILSDAMQSPQKAADLLESLPATERSRVLKIMGDPSKWGAGAKGAVTGATSASVNMLAPNHNVENELVR